MTLREAVLITHYKLAGNKPREIALANNQKMSKYNHPMIKMCCHAALYDKAKWRELLTLVLNQNESSIPTDNRAA